MDTRYEVSKNLIFIYINIIFMYRFSITARCACIYFIEIIEIIEISRHIMGENKKN